ncbi:MAG: hypothetical protein B6242_06010 [Anaerolineaceae bacterium 4572_78]|nr:MAG: hypothetical protein B6242_06010 [Anaerolineaceae bacterium 4572_78]
MTSKNNFSIFVKLCAILLFIIVILSISHEKHAIASPSFQGDSLTIISYPNDGEVVRGIVSVRGSAVHPAFNRYEIHYTKEPVERNDQWILNVTATQPIMNGELAIWDTTNLPDGYYRLRLRVIYANGSYGEEERENIVVANTLVADTPTSIPIVTETPTPDIIGVLQTATPVQQQGTSTPIPATSTIIIEMPVMPHGTATLRLLTMTFTLPTPRPTNEGLPIPEIVIDTDPLRSGCLLGAGGMFAIFILFGVLAAIRILFIGFIQQWRYWRR